MAKSLGYYNLKPIEDMTREELIEALLEMNDRYIASLDDRARVIDKWDASIDARLRLMERM